MAALRAGLTPRLVPLISQPRWQNVSFSPILSILIEDDEESDEESGVCTSEEAKLQRIYQVSIEYYLSINASHYMHIYKSCLCTL